MPIEEEADTRTRGERAAVRSETEARKTLPRNRPTRTTINASLALTPDEYDAITDKTAWHLRSEAVELGEPAVIDGYLVWDDARLPRPESPEI